MQRHCQLPLRSLSHTLAITSHKSTTTKMAQVITTCPNNRNHHHHHLTPDITTMTLTLFSSTSPSVDHTSSTSDNALDHSDSLSSSDFSQHFGGRESLSGPGVDHVHILHLNSNARSILTNSTCLYSQKVDKVRQDEDIKELFHDDNDFNVEFHALDSARSSFSVALKECQEKRSRSEALVKKTERQRTASIDLNNPQHSAATIDVVSSSPRLIEMRKNTVLPRKSGNFPSPGTPSYYKGVGSNRRVTGAALLPLHSNVRALPSKWEDAERWICSPIGVEGRGNASSCDDRALRRPKSKSGPLGAPGVAYYSMYSPVVPMYDGGDLSCHMAGSPFSAGMMMAENLSVQASRRGSGRTFSDRVEPSIARSVSVHGCRDLVCQTQTSRDDSLDDKTDEVKDVATNVSSDISRRDMATQMSPEDSYHSSPRRSSFSPFARSIFPVVEVQSVGSSKSEVRDVQIDERVTMTRWSKKYMGRITGSKGSGDVDECKMRDAEPRSSSWEVLNTLKSISKARRDDTKITAWENLQKAKAEAAIRKLEMKLEKKRSSSMKKIMKKLKSAQKKAQEMRNSVLTNQAVQVSNANRKSVSFFRTRQMGSLSACFTCHAL